MFQSLRKVGLAVSGLFAATTFARADLQLSQHGAVGRLSSFRLQPGDAETFRAFLDQPSGQQVRIIYLDSRGGATNVAIAIGRMIRERGLDTAFQVGRGRCVSACTTVFLGGVHRYYIGGSRVDDGVATRRGLGFHPSTGGEAAEERINQYYRDMGVPGAAQLRYHIYSRAAAVSRYGRRGVSGPEPDRQPSPTADPGTLEPGSAPERPMLLFFAGGRSALAAGVATSTSAPSDPALRD